MLCHSADRFILCPINQNGKGYVSKVNLALASAKSRFSSPKELKELNEVENINHSSITGLRTLFAASIARGDF